MIKKFLLIGLGLTLLIGLPLTLFVLQNQNQTTTKSSAAQATQFKFDVPPDQPIPVNQTFPVDIEVDPTQGNQISFAKVSFTFDNNFLNASSSDVKIKDGFTPVEQPNIACDSGTQKCTVTFTISIGANTSALITKSTQIAEVTFMAKAKTDQPTTLDFSGQNQALSTGSGDSQAENVFAGGTSAQITIGDASNADTGTPVPTDNGGGTGPGGGTIAPGGESPPGNQIVSCTSFTADKTSGNPPLSVTFTIAGSSATDSITKISLNYGDGLVDTIASGSGIGTGSINAQQDHTYQQSGTYTATATLTTQGGSTSTPSTCSQTITVGSGAKGPLPSTGPGQTLVVIGAAGAVLTAIGFALVAGL